MEPGSGRSELVPEVVGHKDGETEVQGGLHSTSKAGQGSCPLPSNLPSMAWVSTRTHPEAWPSAGSQPWDWGAPGLERDTTPPRLLCLPLGALLGEEKVPGRPFSWLLRIRAEPREKLQALTKRRRDWGKDVRAFQTLGLS